uniref:Uncharacterized protein n=1 Tax=Glossina brevipalpis TaxID=37001 RepID=A0A1A9WRL0_9MUSC
MSVQKLEDVDRLLEHYCEEFDIVYRLTPEQEGVVKATTDRGNSRSARDRYTTCNFCGAAASNLFHSHQYVQFDEDFEMVFKEIDDNVPSTSVATKRKNNFVINSKAKVAAKEIYYSICEAYIPQAKYKIHLRTIQHKEKSVVILKENVFITSPMSSENVVQYKIISSLKEEITINLFLNDIRPYIREQIHQELEEFNSTKFNLRLFGEYVKGMDIEIVLTLKHISTNFSAVRKLGEVNEKISELFVEFTKAAEECQERDSSWAIAAFKF